MKSRFSFPQHSPEGYPFNPGGLVGSAVDRTPVLMVHSAYKGYVGGLLGMPKPWDDAMKKLMMTPRFCGA